jgi:SAM-dependent methyltransferase
MKCKICETEEMKFINADISKCLDCGCIQKNKDVNYKQEYNDKNYWFDINSEQFAWYKKDQENWFNYFKDDIKEGIVLEIGGANGYISNLISKNNKVILQELIDIRLPEVKKNKNIYFTEGIIENILDYIPQIDNVIMCNVIEHINNPKKLINNLYTKLNPKGKILISTDDGDNPFGGLIAQLNHPEHTVTFTKKGIKKLAGDKFKINKYWNVSDYLIYTVLEKNEICC